MLSMVKWEERRWEKREKIASLEAKRTFFLKASIEMDQHRDDTNLWSRERGFHERYGRMKENKVRRSHSESQSQDVSKEGGARGGEKSKTEER